MQLSPIKDTVGPTVSIFTMPTERAAVTTSFKQKVEKAGFYVDLPRLSFSVLKRVFSCGL